MKKILLISFSFSFLVSIASYSQYSCESLIITNTDKMTGKKSKQLKESIVISKDNKSGIAIGLIKGSSSIIFHGKALGAGSCIDDDDKILILFRDGDKITLPLDNDFNCKSTFTVYLGGSFGKKKELKLLMTKEVETMRVWTSDGYVQEDFEEEHSKTLKAALNCLSE